MRKEPLVNGQYYHIISRSIAKYIIFNSQEDYCRLMEIIDLYRFLDFTHKYSNFIALTPQFQQYIINNVRKNSDVLVEIVAYCIMPTHIHLILKQQVEKGISKYISRTLNSYSKYFNKKLNRKGPLFDGRFTGILIKTDQQLLHLTRYIHLNPVSAGLVKKPEDWKYTSYGEYIKNNTNKKEDKICNSSEIIDLKPTKYKIFVNDRIAYQKEISMIKYLLKNEHDG